MRRMKRDFADQRITVMGLGRFGGGVGVARFLAERGADVLVTDTLASEELAESIAKLADLEAKGAVNYRLGEHNVSDFTTADLVVVNPAVPPDNRFVRAACAADVPLTSEIRLLIEHLPNRNRTIGVTGSAGKSTTTAMIGHILRRLLGQDGETPLGDTQNQTPGRIVEGPGVWVGGNIGGSLLPHVDEIQPDDWVVLELSSFMLEGLRENRWSPQIAVVTNISPNHLDWHGTMEAYAAAKRTLLEFQDGGVAIVGPGVETHVEMDPGKASITRVGATGGYDLDGEALKLPGRHNRLNATFAIEACEAAVGSGRHDQIVAALADFAGLPHRLAFVGELSLDGAGSAGHSGGDAGGDSGGHSGGGVVLRCYNDSKSTTPEAAKLAIDALSPAKVRIILGGYDKGSDFAELARHAADRCAGVYTIGATGPAIAKLVREALPVEMGRPGSCGGVAWPAASVDVTDCSTLDAAVAQAIRDAAASGQAGQALVLSPGCASWDQFTNYEQRGARFAELIHQASPTAG